MDFQNGIKYPVRVNNLRFIEMIIGCSYYVNVGSFYSVMLGYTGVDTPIIVHTTLEEYHPLQLTVVEHYCLQILYLRTEEISAYQRRIYTITYMEYTPRGPVYYVHFIITSTFLISNLLIY